MLLSLIIPVYNVEKYIERCLLSCINQLINYIDYEIIVVNDGTKDNSMDIVSKYCSKYPHLIKTVSQENKGLSSARNVGLNLAKGDYIWFIDSDDWISSNSLNMIELKLIKEQPDILALCAANIIDDLPIRRNEYKDETPKIGKEAFNKLISPCAPFAVYKKSFLHTNNLYFYEGIYHEDSEFMPKAYYKANKVSFLNQIVYNVYQNPTSITRTINPKKAFDIITVCKSLNIFSKEVSSECIKHLNDLIAMNFNTALSHSHAMDSTTRREFNRTIYTNRYLLDHLKYSSVLKYKIEYVLFKLFPCNTIEIYNLIQILNFGKNK